MQVVQPSTRAITPEYDHLAFHEDSSSPKAGCGGRAVCGGAMPCPCCHIQEMNIIQTLPVCSTPTKYYQPGHNAYIKLAVMSHYCKLPHD